MAIRRRTGDPSYWSSGTLPRPAVSSGDLSGARYTPLIIDPETGEILRRLKPIRGATVFPSKPFSWGLGRSPRSAYFRLQGHYAYQTPRRRAEGKSRSSNQWPPPPLAKLSVRVPTRVKFCLQRKQRREVLFAFRRAGYGGSAPKRHYRRTQNSQYRC